jgi:hypothetical protein
MAGQDTRKQGPAGQPPAPFGLQRPSQEPQRALAEPTKTPEEPKRTYRVLRRTLVGRAMHAPGELVELTIRDAESLGDAVSTEINSPIPEDIAKRPAGLYEVSGPGSIWMGGKAQPPGSLLELTEADARAFGMQIKPVE